MRCYLFCSLALGLSGRFADALKYGDNQEPTHKDSKKLAAAFPEPKNFKLLSPAFQSPETVPDEFEDGTVGPTDDATMDYFLRNLTNSNDWMTYENADFKSEEGRSFPYVYLSKDSGVPDGSKLRVWLQGAAHGNEPAGDQSLLALLGKMDADQTWTASLLDKMDIVVLPRYNPDGVFYFQRYLAMSFDPNRDHIKLARQQTREIKKLFGEFEPHIVADMHEFSAARTTGPKDDLVIAADALFSPAKNLNIDEGIRKMSEGLFTKGIGKNLDKAGFRWDPYVTFGTPSDPKDMLLKEAGTDAKIGRNAMGLSQCLTFLFETRGISIADQHFLRRTATALVMVESLIQIAADNADKVLKTIEAGKKRFVESQDDIILTDSSKIIDTTFKMANVDDGSVRPYPVKFSSSTRAIANLTRTRPEAYIIPRGWSDLAAHLEVLGLDVVQMPNKYVGSVEALDITSVAFEDSYYEGVVRAEVTTQTTKKELSLAAGSFWVSTKQKNAALAFVALEPEHMDSFASFNIISLQTGDEYPIFRVV